MSGIVIHQTVYFINSKSGLSDAESRLVCWGGVGGGIGQDTRLS